MSGIGGFGDDSFNHIAKKAVDKATAAGGLADARFIQALHRDIISGRLKIGSSPNTG